MLASRQYLSVGREIKADESGQALVEFALTLPVLLVLVFGLIDLARALSYMQVMNGLTRQGSNLASRGTSPSAAAAAVVAGDAPLDLTHSGGVIVTSVSNIKSANTITGQASQGGFPCNSRIGIGLGTPAILPPAAATMVQSGQSIYVTEVCYSYHPITPIGNLLIPSTLYDVAFF